MIRIDEVRERIEARVPALAGRLQNAADFAVMVETNRLPQHTPAAFVLPGTVSGGQATAMSGLFVQGLVETVIVVVVHRVTGDALAAKAIDTTAPIVREVVQAVAGWAPDDATGTFVFGQSELVGAKDGALVFQIDFLLDDQLRIIP